MFAEQLAQAYRKLDKVEAERDRLRAALGIAKATIERLAPPKRHGFSSIKGTMDVINAALAAGEEGGI